MEVPKRWELAAEQISGKSRERRASRARREFLVRAHAESGLSTAKLRRIFNMAHAPVREALANGLPEA